LNGPADYWLENFTLLNNDILNDELKNVLIDQSLTRINKQTTITNLLKQHKDYKRVVRITNIFFPLLI